MRDEIGELSKKDSQFSLTRQPRYMGELQLMDKESLDQLRHQDWDAISLRTYKSTRILAARYGWNENTSLPGGQMLEDLVIEAIAELWESPSKVRHDIKITTQLRNIVRRKLSNLSRLSDSGVTRSDEVTLARADELALADAEERGYRTIIDDLFEKAILFLRQHPKIKGKDEHELVLMAFEEGILKPSDVSELTELPIERTYQILRELQSTYPSIAERLAKAEVPTNE